MLNKFLAFLGCVQCIVFVAAVLQGDVTTAVIAGTVAAICAIIID